MAIFIDMDIQDQAMVFATINLKQTKVNRSLAYDLYEFTTSRSPQRTCHDIAKFLNYRQSSPFQGKVKMLGVAREPTETITQATFVDRLLRLVSWDQMKDRDQLKSKKRLGPRDEEHERNGRFSGTCSSKRKTTSLRRSYGTSLSQSSESGRHRGRQLKEATS